MKFIGRLFTRLVYIGFIVVITLGMGLGFYASALLEELPTVDEIRKIPLNIPLRIYSSDNKLIAEYGDERRIPLKLDDVPPLLIDAILVTEDDRFYHHTGVDFPGLARAAISNFLSRSRSQGASTITMQVARNFFLNPEKTYTRKLKEILLAFNMERVLTKDEILALYLNKIFLGHRAYGFAAAAQVYYGDDLLNLSVPEIAMLAGLPKAPSTNNPISNPGVARERRGYVLKRLHELGRIDDLSYQTAIKAPITAQRHVADVELQAPYVSEMARQLVFERFGDDVYQRGLNVTLTVNSEYQAKANQALRKGLLDYDRRHGYRGPTDRIDLAAIADENRNEQIQSLLKRYPSSREVLPALVLETDGKTATVIHSQAQTVTLPWEGLKWARKHINPNSLGPEPDSAGAILHPGEIVYIRPMDEDGWMLSQLPEISGALVSLDPHTGAIRALTGGFDYFLSKFNRATQAKRQPGSNIKPFIYSAALDNGFTASSLVSATPIVIEDDLEGIWRPQNYSKKFFGPTRLRKALSLSINLVSVRLLRALGIDTTIEHLARFGFNPQDLPESLSLALGSIAVTPLDLASHFSVFANGGNRISPYLIEKIEDRKGNRLALPPLACVDCAGPDGEKNALFPAPQEGTTAQDPADRETGETAGEAVISQSGENQGISPQNAFLMTSLLQQVIQSGTGRRALQLGRSDLAGKTGTTNDFRDAWFSGFNPEVTTTVFVGFDEPAHLGRRESGATAALPIWVDYMGQILQDFPEQTPVIPENITTRFINRETGRVTSPEDPEGYLEYYLAGTEPNNPVGAADPSSGSGSTESVSESLF